MINCFAQALYPLWAGHVAWGTVTLKEPPRSGSNQHPSAECVDRWTEHCTADISVKLPTKQGRRTKTTVAKIDVAIYLSKWSINIQHKSKFSEWLSNESTYLLEHRHLLWYIFSILANKKTMPGKSKFTVWPYSFHKLAFLGYLIYFVFLFVITLVRSNYHV